LRCRRHEAVVRCSHSAVGAREHPGQAAWRSRSARIPATSPVCGSAVLRRRPPIRRSAAALHASATPWQPVGDVLTGNAVCRPFHEPRCE
jgi:hypothetical protein